MAPVGPDLTGSAGARGGPGSDGPELARIRSALARGVGLDEALNDAADPATGLSGPARQRPRPALGRRRGERRPTAAGPLSGRPGAHRP